MSAVTAIAPGPVLLARLAHHVLTASTETDPSVVRAVVRVASPLRGQARQDAWDAYLEAVRTEMAIEDGLIDWRDVDDCLTCPDRTEVAREIAQQRSAEALALLTGRTS